MALNLILMRYAKSIWDQPAGDHDYALNDLEYSLARMTGAWLKYFGYLLKTSI